MLTRPLVSSCWVSRHSVECVCSADFQSGASRILELLQASTDARWPPPQHRRGKVCGRARRRALRAHSTRPMPEVSLRVWRHTHAYTTHSLIARYRLHYSDMLGQAAAGQDSCIQWIYMAGQDVGADGSEHRTVQWFALFRRVCRLIAVAGWTSLHSACYSTCCE